ncbi:linear amide C-N hydrolase [Vibrio sp. SCSIO 43140]|uniref:linear amide C-N hydrolase n=1 Tax=Vibrio sp. SCSIO 43140 TaxID=2819100 RepID=UPI002075586B|nr:linear amide C-N hydrolase [Vibrio sp. SCSIO 43140]USD63782.1 linear amide C-N hydrolase [Vibrio sp. SCSIO 43140]
MKNKLYTALATGVITMGVSAVVNACSYSTFEVNGEAFVSRTMEAPDFMGEHFVTVPRNHDINGKSGPVGFVGMRHAETEWISSGLNEYGVNIESLALLESSYLEEGQGDINYLEVVGYILSNAKSVDDAVALLNAVKVETTSIKVAHDLTVGMHYAIRDKHRAIVVEYTDGTGYPTIYDNEIGVMTNDPTYPEQLEIAQSYVTQAKARTDETVDIFNKLDSGSDMRFSHLAMINEEYKHRGADDDRRNNGLGRAFSILNAMEIVPSTMYWLWVSENSQMIGYGNVVDIQSKAYYYRTVNNPKIRKVSLGDIDFESVSYSAIDIYNEPSYL